MKRLKILLSMLSIVIPVSTVAAETSNQAMNTTATNIRKLAFDFLKQQTQQQAAQVSITVAPLDTRLNLTECDAMQAFLPQGSKPWGKLTLGIQCSSPKAWTIYISAQVKVNGDYYVTSSPLAQGQLITADNIVKMTGDLSTLPAGIITRPEQVTGHLANHAMASGSILRVNSLKEVPVILQGQSVKIISSGAGFQVSTDAIASNSAAEGQVAKAKTVTGVNLSGIARSGGIIEVSF